MLGGDDRVASLQLAGSLLGSATLTAARYALDGGSAEANLGAGALTSTGASRLAGTSAATTVKRHRRHADAGERQPATATPTTAVGAGATLTLGGAGPY